MGSGGERSEGPRWLDQEETAARVALAAMVVALPAALDAQLRRDAGIGYLDHQVLGWLSMTPDHTARMSVLAEMATVSQSRLSRIATRLENRGWIRRCPDPDDGRGTLAELTGEGWDTVVAAAPGHVAELRRLLLDQLSAAQVGQLEQIARWVLEAAAPDSYLRVPDVRAAPGAPGRADPHCPGVLAYDCSQMSDPSGL